MTKILTFHLRERTPCTKITWVNIRTFHPRTRSMRVFLIIAFIFLAWIQTIKVYTWIIEPLSYIVHFPTNILCWVCWAIIHCWWAEGQTLVLIIIIIIIIIGIFGLILVIEGILVLFFRHGSILVIFYVSGIFWSFLGFGECFSCYNLLINNNIINTFNYVNIF